MGNIKAHTESSVLGKNGVTEMSDLSRIIVRKFGGTCVGSIERIEMAADVIARTAKENQRQVVIVSAMSGETDRLVGLARRICPNVKNMAYDMLLAAGEQASVALLSLALQRRGVKSAPLLAYQVGIRTDSFFSRARIQQIDTSRLLNYVGEGQPALVAGFQGVTNHGRITTLGRGGSDTTAVAIAAALQQSVCEIFTDVPNVYTADPRLLKGARQMKHVSFEEMMEMSSLGSRVLHHRSVEIAARHRVRIHVRSMFENKEGTWIVPKEELMEAALVSAVTHDENVVVFKLFSLPTGSQFISQLFSDLARRSISVDVITQSLRGENQSLAFSVDREDLHEAKDIIYRIIDKDKVLILENVAKLSIVGVGMAGHPGVAARFFTVLNRMNTLMHIVTTSEIKISVIIDKKYLKDAANALHEEFCLGNGGENGV